MRSEHTGRNTFDLLLCGPVIATLRFFDTLNRIGKKPNEQDEKDSHAVFSSGVIFV